MSIALHSYTLLQWLLLFYIYCFFGWCFESTYVSFCQHRFVNRGFVRLPLLPIYGAGALCILLFCLPYRGNYLLVYVFGVLFPTILEYIVGWAMERMFKMKYWDYSRKKYNLHGYICLSSSLAWGVLSILLIHVIHPPIERLLFRIPHTGAMVFAVLVSLAFAADFLVAFRTAFNLRRVLEDIERLRAQLDETRVQLELARAEALDQLEMLQARTDMLHNRMQSRIRSLNQHYHIRALLRAHPTAASRVFAEPLRAARERALNFRRAMEESIEKNTRKS
jgi:uncharacterized membrane protein